MSSSGGGGGGGGDGEKPHDRRRPNADMLLSQAMQNNYDALTCREILALATTNKHMRQTLRQIRVPKVYVCMRAAEMLAQLRNADGSGRRVANASKKLKFWKKMLRSLTEPIVAKLKHHMPLKEVIISHDFFVAALYMHHHQDEAVVQFARDFRQRDGVIRKKLFTHGDQRELWISQLRALKAEGDDLGMHAMTQQIWKEWQPIVREHSFHSTMRIMNIIQHIATPDERSLLLLAAYVFQSKHASALEFYRPYQ